MAKEPKEAPAPNTPNITPHEKFSAQFRDSGSTGSSLDASKKIYKVLEKFKDPSVSDLYATKLPGGETLEKYLRNLRDDGTGERIRAELERCLKGELEVNEDPLKSAKDNVKKATSFLEANAEKQIRYGVGDFRFYLHQQKNSAVDAINKSIDKQKERLEHEFSDDGGGLYQQFLAGGMHADDIDNLKTNLLDSLENTRKAKIKELEEGSNSELKTLHNEAMQDKMRLATLGPFVNAAIKAYLKHKTSSETWRRIRGINDQYKFIQELLDKRPQEELADEELAAGIDNIDDSMLLKDVNINDFKRLRSAHNRAIDIGDDGSIRITFNKGKLRSSGKYYKNKEYKDDLFASMLALKAQNPGKGIKITFDGGGEIGVKEMARDAYMEALKLYDEKDISITDTQGKFIKKPGSKDPKTKEIVPKELADQLFSTPEEKKMLEKARQEAKEFRARFNKEDNKPSLRTQELKEEIEQHPTDDRAANVRGEPNPDDVVQDQDGGPDLR